MRTPRTLLLAAALLHASLDAIASPTAGEWRLQASRIYVSPEAPPRAGGVIAIREGRITAVEPAPAGNDPRNEAGSCDGGIVTAGFYNSHVHFVGADYAGAATQPAAKLTEALAGMLTRYGYTTVVDATSDLPETVALRRRIESGEVAGPRIVTAGLGLFPADGLPIYISHLPQALLARLPQPPGAEDAARAARENLAGGADAIKLFLATPQRGGVLKRMSPAVARAAAEAAHAKGKPVLAHPTDAEGVRAALDAGVDVLMHTTLGAREPWPEGLLRDVVGAKMAIIPTLKLLPYELAKEKVPEAVATQLLEESIAHFRAFIGAGGTVLFGTDVGYMTDFDPTDEYVLLARAGLTPMRVLAALTTTPARTWRHADRGRIEPGQAADLVVLEGDPASDVRNFARVRCVVREGRIIYRPGGR